MDQWFKDLFEPKLVHKRSVLANKWEDTRKFAGVYDSDVYDLEASHAEPDAQEAEGPDNGFLNRKKDKKSRKIGGISGKEATGLANPKCNWCQDFGYFADPNGGDLIPCGNCEAGRLFRGMNKDYREVEKDRPSMRDQRRMEKIPFIDLRSPNGNPRSGSSDEAWPLEVLRSQQDGTGRGQFAKRTPIIYRDGKVYVGPRAGFHSDLAKEFGFSYVDLNNYRGAILHDTKEPYLYWYNNPGDTIHKHVLKALGVKGENDGDDWHLGASEPLPTVELHEGPSQNDQSWYGWRRPVRYIPEQNKVILGQPGAYHSDLSGYGIDGYVSIGGKQGGDEVPVGLGWYDAQGYDRDPATELPDWHKSVQKALIPHEPMAAQTVAPADDDWDWNVTLGSRQGTLARLDGWRSEHPELICPNCKRKGGTGFYSISKDCQCRFCGNIWRVPGDMPLGQDLDVADYNTPYVFEKAPQGLGPIHQGGLVDPDGLWHEYDPKVVDPNYCPVLELNGKILVGNEPDKYHLDIWYWGELDQATRRGRTDGRGGIEWYDDQPGWEFGSSQRTATRIVEVKQADNVYGNHGTDDHPFQYMPDSDTLYIGPVDTYHNDAFGHLPEVMASYELQTPGSSGRVTPNGAFRLFDGFEHENTIRDALREHMNLEPEGEERDPDWDFTSSLDVPQIEVKEGPGNNYSLSLGKPDQRRATYGRPFLYKNGIVYLGQPGQHHRDVGLDFGLLDEGSPAISVPGYIQGNLATPETNRGDYGGGKIWWYGRPVDLEKDAIEAALGAGEDTADNEWSFTSAGNVRLCEHCQAPNYDPKSWNCWSCGQRLYEPPKLSAELPKVIDHPGEGRAGNSSWGWRRPIKYSPENNTVVIGQPGTYHMEIPNAHDERQVLGYISLGGKQWGNTAEPGLGWFEGGGRDAAGSLPEYHHAVQKALIPYEPMAAHTVQPVDDWGDDSWPNNVVLGASEPQVMQMPGKSWRYLDSWMTDAEKEMEKKHRATWGQPFIYDQSGGNVYLGVPGQHHVDVAHDAGIAVNDEWVRSDRFHGNLRPDKSINWYNRPEDYPVIEQALGGQSEDDDWEFTAAEDVPEVEVYEGDHINAEPYQWRRPIMYYPSFYGQKDRVVIGPPGAWHRDIGGGGHAGYVGVGGKQWEGDPWDTPVGLGWYERVRAPLRGDGLPEYHERVQKALIPHEPMAAHTVPTENTGDWNWQDFGGRLGTTFNHVQHDTPSMWNNDPWGGRLPLLYDPIEDRVHVGQPGRTHMETIGTLGGDSMEYWDRFLKGWVGYNPEYGTRDSRGAANYGWYEQTPPAHVDQAIRKHFQIPDDLEDESLENMSDWEFTSKTAVDPTEWQVFQHQYPAGIAQYGRVPILVDTDYNHVHVGQPGTYHNHLKQIVPNSDYFSHAFLYPHDAPIPEDKADNYLGVGGFIMGYEPPNISSQGLMDVLNHHLQPEAPYTSWKPDYESDDDDGWGYSTKTAELEAWHWEASQE